MCIKPLLTQQALFRATENTYIHSKHKHLPTLHWKYLKKFYVKRNCILASMKKIMLQLLKKRNIGVRQYFSNSPPPPPIWRIFYLVFYPLCIKYGKSIRGGGEISFKNIKPPPHVLTITIIFEPVNDKWFGGGWGQIYKRCLNPSHSIHLNILLQVLQHCLKSTLLTPQKSSYPPVRKF